MDAYAHSLLAPDGQLVLHSLEAHLLGVGGLAREFARPFHGEFWAEAAGRWHDLGKYRASFQAKLVMVSPDAGAAHIEGASGRVTHSTAGALHAIEGLRGIAGEPGAVLGRVLAYLIASHHAGLYDWTGLGQRLFVPRGGAYAEAALAEYREALAARPSSAVLRLDGFDLRQQLASIPGRDATTGATRNPLVLSLWIRMLFSCLVDADFLDTEAFMSPERAGARPGFPSMSRLLEMFDAHMATVARQVEADGRAAEPVIRARASVLAHCRDKAKLPSGIFRLTVPTGGGKTLASLGFALSHAVAHGKRRVIYAIPFTSILEQTADVFRAVFGDENVVEHHSQAEVDPGKETARSRLASENWDAPVVVTTNVQLFESLFAARTSRCRKLHNIAGSVIVLDEAQTLPPRFLQPMLDCLNLLVHDYGACVVLCTATQPALQSTLRSDPRRNLRGIDTSTEIMDDVSALYAALRRVEVELPTDIRTPSDWPKIAAALAAEECALAIVNTKAQARELFDRLPRGTVHLSTALCGAHRADLIRALKLRLETRRRGADATPLRVVSTQLVEAGVDIDFPVVYRALAGLDAVAQAAGRCNREGRLDSGRVVVFVPPDSRLPGEIKMGIQASISVLSAERTDPLFPEVQERYFGAYFAQFDSLDREGIGGLLHAELQTGIACSFREAAARFRLIDDEDQVPLVVPYRGPSGDDTRVDGLLGRLRSGVGERWLLRALQRYTVNLRRREADRLLGTGAAEECFPGMLRLRDELLYHPDLGFVPESGPISPGRLIQ